MQKKKQTRLLTYKTAEGAHAPPGTAVRLTQVSVCGSPVAGTCVSRPDTWTDEEKDAI